MTLASGARLGPYEVLSAVGAGGMGEVYRARDPRLGRDVAIKVLPASFSADPDRLRRFEREARAAARLNHPNILTVHEIAAHDGQPYVVSELLEGETLRHAIERGPMPVKKALDCAIQMCRGLAVAHEKGIVHRDLKPENVFVTSDGRVKILDFGLAKLTEAAAASAETILIGAHVPDTSPGLVVGTVGYMSPEQVRCQPVDHRSDIFNVGAIVYELLSGTRAFAGATPADTLSDILGKDPPELTIGHRSVSPALDRIVRHCLEKSPSQRFQSVSDVAFAFESAGITTETPVSAAPPSRSRPRRTTAVIAATAIGAASVGALAIWRMDRVGAPPASDHLSLTEVARLTHDVGFSDSPVWSPDGKVFAFSSNKSGNFEIYVRRVDGGDEINITKDPSEDIQPAFSPDGTKIAFVSTRRSKTGLQTRAAALGSGQKRTTGGDVWVTSVFGGHSLLVAVDGNFPVWRADGRAIAYVSGPESRRSILEAPAEERGEPKTVLSSSASKWDIARLRYSPDGRWLTFEPLEQRVLALPTTGGTPQDLVRGQSHAWDPRRQRLYVANEESAGGTRLLSADLHTESGVLSATVSPVALVTGLVQDLSVSPDGQHILASEVHESLNLTLLPLTPRGDPAGPEEELSTSGQVQDRYPSVSRDGRRVLLGSNRLGVAELWTLDLESRKWERIQVSKKSCDLMQASWAPDGRHVAAACYLPDKTYSILKIALDGSALSELVSPRPVLERGSHSSEFSHDGNRLLYSYVKEGFNQLFTLDLLSKREHQVTTSPSDKYDGRWSFDDRWIVFSSNAGGSAPAQAWKVPASGGQEQQLTSSQERMRHVFYSPDGRWIYVQPSHRNIWRLPAEGGQLQRVTNFPESGLFLEEPAISPDGKFFVYSKSRGGSSLWLLTLGATIPHP